MKFNIDHFLKLANLSLEDKEKETLKDQMERIIEWVDKIRRMDIDTSTYFTQKKLSIIKREDREEKGLSREEALSISPQHDGEYFVVPSILRK